MRTKSHQEIFNEWMNAGATTIVDFEITPQFAEYLLTKNIMNRRIREGHVNILSQKMKMRQWENNYNPIVFSSTSILIDGQHRLEACKKIGIPFISDIRLGADISHFPEIDTGINRTIVDVLDLSGFKNNYALGAILSEIYKYKTGNHLHNLNYKLARIEIIKLAEKYMDIGEICPPIYRRAREAGIIPKIAGFTYYCFYKSNKTKAIYFYDKLLTGREWAHTDNSIYILRRNLMMNLVSRKKYSKEITCAIIIKSWNDFLAGKNNQKTVVFKKGEKFPIIKGCSPEDL